MAVAVSAFALVSVLLADRGGAPRPPISMAVAPATSLGGSTEGAAVRYVPYGGAPIAVTGERVSVADAASAVQHVSLPRLSEVLDDRWDSEALVYGGDGTQGGLLPIDNGVVLSSGPRFATDWELILPSAGIRAAVVRVGLTADGAMGSPDNPFVVGWYRGSPEPGESGNVLLGGHRDYEDRDGNVDVGVCWELDRTSVGDQMIVHDRGAERYFVYEVVDTAEIRPASDAAARYLSQTLEPVVTLLTCSGSFDPETHSYDRRLVVVGLLRAVAAPDA